MKVNHHTAIEAKVVEMDGAHKTKVRWLISQADGAENFAMRMFEIDPGGHTPRHQHDYEHEIYVLEGEGTVVDGTEQRPLKAGDVVYVNPQDVHQFRNDGTRVMKMLCLIPSSAAGKQVTVVPECGVEPSGA